MQNNLIMNGSKTHRVLNRLNSNENWFDNDKDDFVPISKIIQLVREKMIENNIKDAKNRVIKGSHLMTFI